jgi:hypothetical protein
MEVRMANFCVFCLRVDGQHDVTCIKYDYQRAVELTHRVADLEVRNKEMATALHNLGVATDRIIAGLCERNAELEKENKGLAKILQDTLAAIPTYVKAHS